MKFKWSQKRERKFKSRVHCDSIITRTPLLQNKTAVACGKRDNDDQQCGDVVQLKHLHKKKTKAPHPVKIKVKARANKYARYILWFKWFTQVCSVNLWKTMSVPNCTQSFCLSRKCDRIIFRTLMHRTRRSVLVTKTNRSGIVIK